VRLVHAPIKGAGAARNVGLELANGEFLQFLDSDDLLLPWKIERQVATLTRTKADVAWGPFWTYERVLPNGPFEMRRQKVPAIGDDVARDLLGPDGWVQLGCALLRRDARVAPLRFVSDLYVDDVDYMLQVAFAGTRWVRSDGDSGLLFREHEGARVSSSPAQRLAVDSVTNARMALRVWRARDALTPSRIDAVVDVYLFAARTLFQARPDLFNRYLAEVRALDPDFVRRLPTRLRLPSRIIGYPRVERIARAVRQTKTLLRRFVGRRLNS
jgi:glycosyltransferase involved in cell wall biosynthesis